jgi:hypothetical protein
MTQEAFEKAKAILARIAELEKKGEKIPDVKSVRVSVSYNGVSFVDASTILTQEAIDQYKSNIADDCNKTNSAIKETISNLYSEFFSL